MLICSLLCSIVIRLSSYSTTLIHKSKYIIATCIAYDRLWYLQSDHFTIRLSLYSTIINKNIHVAFYALVYACIFHQGNSFQLPNTHISKTRCHFLLPWCEVEVDYLAANKYIQTHYGKQYHLNPYFCRWVTDSSSDISSIGSSSRVLEPIYDTQKGVYDDNFESYQTASLPICSFLSRNLPSNFLDWNNINQIQRVYLRELEAHIPLIFTERQPRHVAFWNLMLRAEDYTIQRDNVTLTMCTSNVVSMFYIGAGVSAFKLLEVVIGTVENNYVSTTMGG